MFGVEADILCTATEFGMLTKFWRNGSPAVPVVTVLLLGLRSAGLGVGLAAVVWQRDA